MDKSVGFSFAVLTAIWASGVSAAQTVAPPDLQNSIRHIFPQSPNCGPATDFKVISSERSVDAKFENGALVAGEIREIWQATPCEGHKRIKYLFRFAAGEKGALQIVGFEPMR